MKDPLVSLTWLQLGSRLRSSLSGSKMQRVRAKVERTKRTTMMRTSRKPSVNKATNLRQPKFRSYPVKLPPVSSKNGQNKRRNKVGSGGRGQGADKAVPCDDASDQ